MGLFGRTETRRDPPSGEPSLHEQLAALRGRIAALELEWDDVRGQIRKGYQRMEKAHQRAEAAKEQPWPEEQPAVSGQAPPGTFAEKFKLMRGG